MAKAKLMIHFAGVHILVCLVDITFYNYFEFQLPRYCFLIPPAMLIGALSLLRTHLSLAIIAHLVIAGFWVSFLIIFVFAGGIFSVVTPWLAALPMLAYLLINTRAAKIWFVVSLLTLLFFTLFFTDATVLQNSSGIKRLFISYFGLTVAIFFFSHLFHSTVMNLLVDLKKVNASIVEHQEEMMAQNEELTQQRDEISAQRNYIEQQNEKLVTQNAAIKKVNEEFAKKVNEIVDRNKLLERHWHTLLNISKSKSINSGELESALSHIVKTAATSLETHRVSIWKYNKNRNSIECLLLYRLTDDTFEHGAELLGKDYPHYFEALMEEDVIPADDAETDSHTFEFKDNYLRPQHILSMLDIPFFLDGKLGGVICCENMEHRHWLPEDILFVQALSDIVTLVFRTAQRRQYELKIRTHQKEIIRINQSLEDRIQKRTEELENQNKQLAEYAFINAHILRGPLCRILGLINLIENSEIKSKEEELINHLKLSGKELDDVVKKINKAIDNGSHFDRSEFAPPSNPQL